MLRPRPGTYDSGIRRPHSQETTSGRHKRAGNQDIPPVATGGVFYYARQVPAAAGSTFRVLFASECLSYGHGSATVSTRNDRTQNANKRATLGQREPFCFHSPHADYFRPLLA